MSQKSEERVPEPVDEPLTNAQVIPFERPQSELQKAVQQRAQETLDREHDRAHQKPPVWRRVLLLLLAAIPVVLTFGAAVSFVGALRQFHSKLFEGAPAQQAPAPATSPQSANPDPDVVMLQPVTAPEPSPAPQGERGSNTPEASK